jgi:hypothetical protein
MATTILERNNLSVTRHVGHCGGCGAATLNTKAPTYQVTALAAPEQKEMWAYISLCGPCIREVAQAIEGAA